MAKETVRIVGVGTSKIDLELLDVAARDRLIDCIKKNGKISIVVGEGRRADGTPDGGFAQQID